MDKFVELSAVEAQQLRDELLSVNLSLYKIRVYMDDNNVKFKVNEHMWSPPMGKMVAGQ